jgi:signal transduction histidine kinase/ActR/RegA family two-component response regulator
MLSNPLAEPIMSLPRLYHRYRHLLRQDDDSVIKTTIRLLLICFLGFIGLFTSLIILYLFQEHNFLLIRAGIMLALFIIGLAFLLFKVPWTVSAHIFISCLTVLIWSNILFFPAGLTIITVQYTVLVLAASYYMLGVKWGLVYSLINILPLIAKVFIDEYLTFIIPVTQHAINIHAYTLTICFNFLLLMYVHYSFFKALTKSKQNEIRSRKELQKTLKEAQELAIAKTNFLTTMSHELRTPLNAMVGMTNILMMEDPREEQAANLKILKFSAENLTATVNDILDFNKINNEVIVLEQNAFKLAELLEDVVAAIIPVADLKALHFDCRIDPHLANVVVAGDRMRLTQILFNLIGNAVKFTERGFVSVKAKVIEVDENQVRVHFNVEDSGIGIPDELKQKIFEPFSRSLSRTSRQFHGTLGLTIAAQLVKLHQSELIFQSTEGKGSTFEFELVYPVTQLEPTRPARKAVTNISELRVLIVEDEKLNILVLTKILSKWGIISAVAENGQQAVDMVTENDYDIILMDINMPVMDGFEASKQIRNLNLPGKSSIPIIAITASVGAAIEQVKDYPFIDDCLLKPFDPAHLKEKLMTVAKNMLLPDAW